MFPRRGDTILGWFVPHTFEQGRHFDEITSWPSRVVRILLLRRLRLPLPFTARSCVWQSPRQLGPPSLGLLSCWDLWTKGFSSGDCCGPHLPRSRWKGADQRFAELDLGVGGVLDNSRLEVVVDGLPLFNGAQLAVDTTLVSPIRHDGTPGHGHTR